MIEAVHHVLKNKLAAGVMPCGRFGANAAWVPLTVLTHNVLTALNPQDSLSNDLVAAPTTCRYASIRTTPRMGHLKSFGETPVGVFR